MNSKEVYDLVMQKKVEIIPDKEFNDLQKLMLEEVCENIVKGTDVSQFSHDQIIIITMSALEVSQSMWKGMIKGSLEVGDILNVNYRSKTFTYTKETYKGDI